MREVNIYVKSNIKSTRKRNGHIGYVLELVTDKGEATKSKFEEVEKVTANQSELVAINRALKRMTEKCVLTIYTDSAYIGSAFDNKWIEGWKKKNWLNAKNEPIANNEEWQEMLNLLVGQHFSIVTGFKHKYSMWMESELARLKSEKG